MNPNATAAIAKSKKIDPPKKSHNRVFEIARATAKLTPMSVIKPESR